VWHAVGEPSSARPATSGWTGCRASSS